MVTRQPLVVAACRAKPPQPVPISSTWSSARRSSRRHTSSSLARRGLRERHPLAREVRGGVHHRLVEHQREELVPEVVVGGDRAAAARARVARTDPAGHLERNPRGRKPAAPLIQLAGVAGGDAHDRRQIRRFPQSVHVGLGHPAAATQQHRPEAGRAHLDRRLRAAVAERERLRALDDRQPADAHRLRSTPSATRRARRSVELMPAPADEDAPARP